MDSRSGSRLTLSSPDGARSVRLRQSSDRISALSDDMILLVLSHLGSVRAAARTALLSRRWRGLWTRLADLAFCTDAADKIESALARFSSSPVVSSIHIRLPNTNDPSSLLRAAALLSPAELVFVLKENIRWLNTGRSNIVLPCFHLTTSIDLDVGFLSISPPAAGEFPVLEKLSLAGKIVELGTLFDRCPRLHILCATFRGASNLGSLHAALRFKLSFLAFDTRNLSYLIDYDRFGPLLCTMVKLSPQKLIFTHDFGGYMKADLPCFHHATSVEMNLNNVCFTPVPYGEFSALERLSLSRSCSIIDLDTLVSRCPCLRVLKVTVATGNVTVHSASLHELDVYSNKECHRIDIVAPMLKKLELRVKAGSGRELSVSISTPIIEKVSWERWYTTSALMFGFWRLECATLENRQGNDPCSHLRHVHALCLHISSIVTGRMGLRPNFSKEMEKLLITDFSMLDVNLRTCGHVYGALVFRILGMHRVRTATEKLKIVLLQCCPMETQECPNNCLCRKPKNWRSQSISFPRLQEVEIYGFNGDDHEHHFLGFISKCSPMLKRVTVKLAHSFGGCTTKIYSSFLAYPSVNCYVYSSSGKLV